MKTKRILKRLGLFVAISAITCIASTLNTHGGMLYYADYEEGEILDEGSYGIGVEKGREHSVNVADTVARKGKRSVRFESRRDDPEVAGSPGRAELKVKRTKPIVEEWYAWSIYTGENMEPDVPEILGQWHASPDFDDGEDWRSPPMAVSLREDKWHVSGHYAPQRVNDNDNRRRAFSETIGKVKKGAWTDWVFHIKWDYREADDGGTGYVQAWQQVDGDGYEKVIDYKGPIGYNDERGVYLKWGIYKYPWNTGKCDQRTRVHYYDEVKIGDAEATFNQMKVSD
ncbi:MAG: polysaccharide lyase [Verrucomicrobia bacterium]|nr:polysaccharide lyase [Verrucomicrobiota bacterium]